MNILSKKRKARSQMCFSSASTNETQMYKTAKKSKTYNLEYNEENQPSGTQSLLLTKNLLFGSLKPAKATKLNEQDQNRELNILRQTLNSHFVSLLDHNTSHQHPQNSNKGSITALTEIGNLETLLANDCSTVSNFNFIDFAPAFGKYSVNPQQSSIDLKRLLAKTDRSLHFTPNNRPIVIQETITTAPSLESSFSFIPTSEFSEIIKNQKKENLNYKNFLTLNLIQENIILKETMLRSMRTPYHTAVHDYLPVKSNQPFATANRAISPYCHSKLKSLENLDGNFNSVLDIQQYHPLLLTVPEDKYKLSYHQIFLRNQIEFFEATENDLSIHIRGRNKRIKQGQVGIRCRHCAHIPVVHRKKGSTYYPSSLKGIYQAAQNMSSSHMQAGTCNGMSRKLAEQFTNIFSSKVTSSAAGRSYWVESARKKGLKDTEEGIQFVHNLC